MEEIEHRSKTITFKVISGTVEACSKFASSSVSANSSGVSSKTVWIQEFWIKDGEGIEYPLKLTDSDLPLRTGQSVAVLLARLKGRDGDLPVGMINYSAKMYWNLKKGADVNNYFRIDVVTGLSIIPALLILAFVGLYNESWMLGLSCALAFLIFRSATKGVRVARLVERLDAAINNAMKSLGGASV
ncbi:hypothetical protein [Ectopseudomonas mendocina]|uniref:Uncharacterized protein n=1 Tax=Ectopseudomonas mendocina S5.2 TaxID=1225174 RepID=A0ABN4J4W1_ECTME|nr:hypothetical protein [Pseudomonas mendocina]ALN21784.1 hypothetical protein DW68_024205 [Pseudomonas mendocina S5.2]KER98159.1 hypothetical protein HN51_25520 [Pseudomonas mendocina]